MAFTDWKKYNTAKYSQESPHDPGTEIDEEEAKHNRLVDIELYNGMAWRIPYGVKKNIDIILTDLAMSEMDAVIVVDGYEGTGKSFNARGLGMYAATFLRRWFPKTTFGVEDINFDTETYVNESLIAGKPNEINQRVKINDLDEGRNALNRKRTLSKSNVRFTNYLSECRAFQQVHIVLAPAFHDLDRNLILWRLNMLIHTVKAWAKNKKSPSGVKLRRGAFKVYTKKKDIQRQYEFPYNYPKVSEAEGFWSPIEVFTPKQIQEYNDKKTAATTEKYGIEKKMSDGEKRARNEDDEYLGTADFGKKIGTSANAVNKMCQKGQLDFFKLNKLLKVNWTKFKEDNGLK